MAERVVILIGHLDGVASPDRRMEERQRQGHVWGGRDGRRGRTLQPDCVSLAALCVWLVLASCSAEVQPIQMYLNSHKDCGTGDNKVPWHAVKPESLYSIKDDMSPPGRRTKPFVENCRMVFRSSTRDGRLCVFERVLRFHNGNVELKLFDGYEGSSDKRKVQVVSDEEFLTDVEWCTRGNILTLEMAKRKTWGSVDDVDIDLLVYHISSPHRKAYMDTTPFCDSRYELAHSRVQVASLDPSLPAGRVMAKCYLHFVYAGPEVRNICLIFDPVPTPDPDPSSASSSADLCPFNYTLHVVQQGKSTPVLSLRGCGKPFHQRRWCSNSTTNSTQVTLQLERHSPREEQRVLFHALVMDHRGGASTLPLLTSDEEVDSVNNNILVISMCATVFLIIIIASAVIAVWVRRRCKKPPEDVRRNGDMAYRDRMIPGCEDCPKAQNHYTDRPDVAKV
ncbi:hypothetical protein ACOMHN_009311 [Nucella lapillus]